MLLLVGYRTIGPGVVQRSPFVAREDVAECARSATRRAIAARSRPRVTAPIAGKSYKRCLTIEVIATDTFGLSDTPTAVISDLPVTVQLVSSNGGCWQAVYHSTLRDQGDQFKAKAD